MRREKKKRHQTILRHKKKKSDKVWAVEQADGSAEGYNDNMQQETMKFRFLPNSELHKLHNHMSAENIFGEINCM